ncbi:MAG: pentapeptide repeat-containing protein, partial [Cyanobacteria bacterium P01_F01_bin.13]
DCCHSGSLLVDLEAANPGNDENRNRCFIASSRDFEQSWEDVGTPYSVLTKALLEGLDPTRLPEGQIDTSALVAYVTKALKGGLQVPICTTFGEAITLTGSLPIQPAGKVANDPDAVCPYKGLSYFDDNDYDYQYFYGRQALTDELIDAVRTSNFVAIVGASGSGKSSVLRAGLLHQLKQGRISGSDQWDIRLMLPGESPCQALAEVFVDTSADHLERTAQLVKAEDLIQKGADGLRRLVQTAESQKVMLVIDQFEEVFTLCQDDAERQHFFETVLGALETSENKLCVVLAMRADFVGKCLEQEYSGLAKILPTRTISVLPLTEDEFRDAICKPAEQVNLTIEPALVTEILTDIKGAPGSLPLLQYTLKELWQRRQTDTLMLSTYQELGGINGTLDKRATEIYNTYDADQQRTVQHIFQQLTQLGEGTEDTRRRVFLDNLISEPLHPAERVRTVIDTLSSKDNRLLVTSEVIDKGENQERRAIVDVAHEALIRHWQLLRQWIEKNRDLLRQQRRIEASAVNWQNNEQSKRYLLQGFPLNEALQFQKQQVDTFSLSEPAKQFIQKSVWQKRLNLLKGSVLLVIPAVIIAAPIEHFLREDKIRKDYSRLDSENKSEEKQAVQDLVAGCFYAKSYSVVPRYFLERVVGHCRSLRQARLSRADLSGTDLRSADLPFVDLTSADLRNVDLSNVADLRYADLRNADLRNAYLKDAFFSYADLRNADLRNADFDSAHLNDTDLRNADLTYAYLEDAFLSDADLRNADLTSVFLGDADLRNADLTSVFLGDADLRNADLNDAIFLATDLSVTKGLTQKQLEGSNQPFLCNSPLPQNTTIKGGKDRDCDQLASVLHQRYPDRFKGPEAVAEFIIEQRQKTWE